MVLGACFISSIGISSHPGLLFGFILVITLQVLSELKGITICVGGMALKGCLFCGKSL